MKKVVDIRKWGQPMWDVMYSIAFSYPEQPTPRERAAITDFMHSLEHILPCEYCRDHLAAFIQSNPVPTDSSEDLSNWILRLQNDVNTRTGKPHITMQDVWDRLVNDGPGMRRQCVATAVSAFLVGVVLVYMVYSLARSRR